MGDQSPAGGSFGAGDIWNDVPLFREIQRVLLSSSGPVNWELARQVGIATASSSGDDPHPVPEDLGGFEDAVRLAELQVAGFTGLEPPGDLPKVEAVRRTQWVERNLDGLRVVMEPAAAKLGEAVGRAQRELLPEGAETGGLEQLLTQLSPLLLGTQVGTVLGTLGQQVLGQYDIAIPRPGGSALLFVVPNIAGFERNWSLDPTEFRTWIAIHEVTHRFEFARPWALGRFRELLDDFTSTMRLDVEDLRDRLASLDPANPEAMREVFEADRGMFGPVLDDEQRLKLGRIQAFMAAAEGYGDHVMHALGAKMLPSYARIEEAMRRYRESEQVDPVLERLLGIEVKREQYRSGRAFCDAVAEATDEPTLARMWDSAEALPSLPELDEPMLWLARST
ncbi:MAG TPA: zinc-dependent metalloprotease [Actinomycetota bacterium]|jgi:putative hydrolase|nr:zinc-dependent metalloprotease [Actinomycetota bacterium]